MVLTRSAIFEKNRRNLKEQQNIIESEFYDFQDKGIDRASVVKWIDVVGWENLLNRRSTTWRTLTTEITRSIDGNSVIDLMLEKPVLIKRPVFEQHAKVLIGFKETQKKELKLLSTKSRRAT